MRGYYTYSYRFLASNALDFLISAIEALLGKANLSFCYRVTVGSLVLMAATVVSYGTFFIARRYGVLIKRDALSTHWACLFFVLINISSTLIYYSVHYDRKGTYMPAWAGNLG
jgi:hypothetical protein